MKRFGHVGTRRQLFTAMAAAAASVPFLASTKKSVAAGASPWSGSGYSGSGNSGSGNSGSGYSGSGNSGSGNSGSGNSGSGYSGSGYSGSGYSGSGYSGSGYSGSGYSGSGYSGPGHSASCLLKGTRVSTPAGDRPVQELQIGDHVQTPAGPKAIKWIGYNKFTKEEGKPWLDSVMPVRVARFAIDDHSPHSDLYLSPLHCIFFNEALFPVKHLINGTSIAQGAPSDMSAVEYYHIDLGTHEVLYAEGVLVESFFDGESDREHFSNFVEYERLYGPERQPKMTPFAPIFRYRNRREKVAGAARSLMSNFVDVRDPVQIAHDQLARRAEALFV